MVRVSVPCTGCASRMMPAPTASAAEISDHQKPGICRAQNVSAQAGDAADQKHPAQKDGDGKARKRRHDHGGEPQDHEQDAFDQKAFQCSRTAALISDCSLVMSWGRVIENLPMPATEDDALL